jgi:hypothetical protein
MQLRFKWAFKLNCKVTSPPDSREVGFPPALEPDSGACAIHSSDAVDMLLQKCGLVRMQALNTRYLTEGDSDS